MGDVNLGKLFGNHSIKSITIKHSPIVEDLDPEGTSLRDTMLFLLGDQQEGDLPLDHKYWEARNNYMLHLHKAKG
jgi:hypothetical protein